MKTIRAIETYRIIIQPTTTTARGELTAPRTHLSPTTQNPTLFLLQPNYPPLTALTYPHSDRRGAAQFSPFSSLNRQRPIPPTPPFYLDSSNDSFFLVFSLPSPQILYLYIHTSSSVLSHCLSIHHLSSLFTLPCRSYF